MSNRGARRSSVQRNTIEKEARAEAIRALKVAARASLEVESPSAPRRALTIREKIARWLEEKL